MRIKAHSSLSIILLCLAVILTGFGSMLILPAKTAVADPACVNGGVYVLFARGSGEHFNDVTANQFYWSLIGSTQYPGALTKAGVSSAWAELGNLDNDFHVDPDEYHAAGGMSHIKSWITDPGYGNSVRIGTDELVKHLNDRVRRCPHESIVLGGYSQGADVVGWALQRSGGDSNWSLSAAARSHIGFVALYGDPKFNPGTRSGSCSVNSNPPSWLRVALRCDWFAALAGDSGGLFAEGFLGARQPYIPADFGGRVGSWCDPWDFVCTGDLDDFVYGVSVHTSAYRSQWIAASAAEIASKAIAKRNALNPAPTPVHVPTYTPSNPSTTVPASVPIPSTPVAVSRNPNTMDVFYNDGADHLVNWSWDVNSGWNAQHWNDDIRGQPAVVARDDGNMDVFYRTAEGKLVNRGWNVSNGWSGPNTLLMSGEVGYPSVVARDPGKMQVFYRTATGEIKSIAWDWRTGWNLNPQRLSGPGATSDPTAIARSSSSMDVFFGKNNGHLVHLGWTAAYGWNTQDWGAGSGVAEKPTAITRNGGGDMSADYQESSGKLGEEFWNWQTGWGWQDWSAQLVGSPSAIPGVLYPIEVFYRETGGNIVDHYFNGTSWASNWIVGAGGATGNPYAIVRGSNEDVFYWKHSTLMDADWNATNGWTTAPVR